MKIFSHREFTYYFFGLRAGLANLRVNGLQLGLKKTAGKITQPINSYTRFPEYYWFDQAIQAYLAEFPSKHKPAILDIGSPKVFGLYVAQKNPVDLTLTDISEINIDEYQVMWKALQGRAKGQARFSLEDARELHFPAEQFDIVYSMSVLEHIEGESGDARAISELLRVLKPGGLLILSVPFGNKYMEQKRVGFAGAARKTGDEKTYFFQRIYDGPMFQSRLMEPLAKLQAVRVTTVQRTRAGISRTFGAMGENVRGVLGALNPILSTIGNRSRQGIDGSFATEYSELHTARDVYGDLILAGIKP